MNGVCQVCGFRLALTADVMAGRASYADSQGGHFDRHTLVVEEAQRLIEEVDS